MKKRNLILIFAIAALLLLTSCKGDLPANALNTDIEKEETDTDTPIEYIEYKFPPSLELLQQYITDVRMPWSLGSGHKKTPNSAINHNTFALRYDNEGSTIIGFQNIYPSSTDNSKSMYYAFQYMQCTEDEYQTFLQDVWPKFWLIAGNIFGEPEAVAKISEDYFEYFDNNEFDDGSIELPLEWNGRLGDVHCTVIYYWNYAFNQYLIGELQLKTTEYLESINQSLFQQMLELNPPLSIVSVSDIENRNEVDSTSFATVGRLENITPNKDILDFDSTDYPCPGNTDQYLKAELVDDTGSISVYILPTSFTIEELESLRLHNVNIINAPTPFYLIDISVADYESILG